MMYNYKKILYHNTHKSEKSKGMLSDSNVKDIQIFLWGVKYYKKKKINKYQLTVQFHF